MHRKVTSSRRHIVDWPGSERFQGYLLRAFRRENVLVIIKTRVLNMRLCLQLHRVLLLLATIIHRLLDGVRRSKLLSATAPEIHTMEFWKCLIVLRLFPAAFRAMRFWLLRRLELASLATLDLSHHILIWIFLKILGIITSIIRLLRLSFHVLFPQDVGAIHKPT